MTYLEISIPTSSEEEAEILLARLAEFPLESFETASSSLRAFAKKEEIENHLPRIRESLEREISLIEHPDQNWNALWESNFEAVQVDEAVVVRADFHKASSAEHEIIINPKMAFGTGHHETTWLMLKKMSEMKFEGKKVLDMGCGTYVLGIYAAMKGARVVEGIDNDVWAVENSVENIERNSVKESCLVIEGEVADIPSKDYDIILANINRNVLLADIPSYVACLQNKGMLLLSGVLTEDFDLIHEKAEQSGLGLQDKQEKKELVAIDL